MKRNILCSTFGANKESLARSRLATCLNSIHSFIHWVKFVQQLARNWPKSLKTFEERFRNFIVFFLLLAALPVSLLLDSLPVNIIFLPAKYKERATCKSIRFRFRFRPSLLLELVEQADEPRR